MTVEQMAGGSNEVRRARGNQKEKAGSQKRIVVIIGPEGSGKSTQAALLSDALGIPWISIGDIFRELSETHPGELGRRAQRMFEEHRYSDPQLFEEAFHWHFQRDPHKKRDELSNGFILEGAFRTAWQIENFERMLRDVERDMPVTVVYLRVPVWRSVERMSGRGREEDSQEGIHSRLSNYYTDLSTRASLIKTKWDFVQVWAGDGSEEIHGRIMEQLRLNPRKKTYNQKRQRNR